jgi:GAF domain-containing protein
MAAVLFTEKSVDELLQLLLAMACASLDGVDEASVSLRRTGTFETSNATSDGIRGSDRTQYQSGKGPCIAATVTGELVNVALAETAGEWPAFAQDARARGFSAVLSVPLRVNGDSTGALNLYSRSTPLFPDSEVEAAKLFAHHASIVLSNAAAFAAAEMVKQQLEEALATRDIIGQAKGILMAHERCTSDEAFDVLRRASQRTNRKLRDVARDVVEANARGQAPYG